jgi:hypothetical protein
MKLTDIENLKEGDIVVISKKLKGWAFNKFEVGEKFKFHNFRKLDIMSASTIYLIRENGELCSFTSNIASNILPLQEWRQSQLEKLV